MRRRGHAFADLVALLGGALFLVAPAASAQAAYPTGACTATTSSHDAGGHDVGGTFTITAACSFTPAAVASISVDGQSRGRATAARASASHGRVSFTMAEIVRWGAVALVLVSVGATLVIADRRRARARS